MTGPVLVLGATGTVGREVLRGLGERGAPARAAARTPSAAVVAGGAPVVRFDLSDRSTWAPALDGVTALFLMRPPAVVAVRRDLLPFVDAAVAAGVSRVAFLSVQGAERIRVVPHRTVERHLEGTGVEWTFLRAGYFLQNLLSVHRVEIRDRDEISVPAGGGRTAFVDARDVAEVAVLALTEPGHERRAYELTGATAATYGDVAAVLSDVLGRAVRYPAPSPAAYVRGSRHHGMPWPLVLTTLVLYTTARLGLAGRTSPELGSLLGHPPRDVRRFVEDHAAAWAR